MVKTNMEYQTPEVKTIELNVEGSYLQTSSSFGAKNRAGNDFEEDDDYTYEY